MFHKLPLHHEFEQFGARTSLLFITCSHHESSVFASLERPFLCETLAQQKKLNVTFGLAFKSNFQMDYQDSRRSNDLGEVAVRTKLS